MNAAITIPTTPAIAPDRIIEAFGALRGIDICQVIDTSNRSGAIVWPRHELSYLLWTLGGLSYADIGDRTGGRDATTVMNSLRRVLQRRREDDVYTRILNAMEAQVKAHAVAKASGTPGESALAQRVMAGSTPADSEALAVNTLSALAILGAPDLTDAEARVAALRMLGRDGGRL